jgi:hypothetical protein
MDEFLPDGSWADPLSRKERREVAGLPACWPVPRRGSGKVRHPARSVPAGSTWTSAKTSSASWCGHRRKWETCTWT